MTDKIFYSVSEEIIGKEVTLFGLAADAKAGACLQVKDDVVYIQELASWQPEFIGKNVYVTGTLLEKKVIPDPIIDKDGAISTGAVGDQYILEDIKEIRKE